MSAIAVKTNMPEFLGELEKVGSDTQFALRGGLNRAAVLVQNTAVKSIQKSSGKFKPYRVTKGGDIHWSSPEGAPPNSNSGDLAKMLLITENIQNKLHPFVTVASTAKYSMMLEMGTTHMEPRPFMQPALDANKKKILAIMRAALRKGLT